MASCRFPTTIAGGAALSLCLLASPAQAAGQADAQTMLMNNFIKIAAAGAGIATVCGASDAEIEQMKATQKQQLLEQHGSLPADFDQRFDAAVADRVTQAKGLSPAQRQQACEQVTESFQQMAEQTRSGAGDN